METRCFVIERVDTIQNNHVQVNIEIQSRPKSLDKGDDAGSGATSSGETGSVDEVGLEGLGYT